jgi:hypothetical protein
MSSRLISDAKALGFRVIDLEPLFLAAFAANGKMFEYPTDPHWNAYAHGVVAAAVREALADWPPLNRPAMTEHRP